MCNLAINNWAHLHVSAVTNKYRFSAPECVFSDFCFKPNARKVFPLFDSAHLENHAPTETRQAAISSLRFTRRHWLVWTSDLLLCTSITNDHSSRAERLKERRVGKRKSYIRPKAFSCVQEHEWNSVSCNCTFAIAAWLRLARLVPTFSPTRVTLV